MNPKIVVPLLLDWFAGNARDLPWRRTRDPYGIWVSEIMLQQTQVKTVIPFWERWMRELPMIEALARANSRKIHKLWEGLGYYTRVRNMQKAARAIVSKHGGRFPTRYEDVLELPGIGRYTAGAICSIAFNQPTPILDGNVIRVLARLDGIDGDPRDRAVNASLWETSERLVREAGSLSSQTNWGKRQGRSPDDEEHFECSHVNQALMELGALVCTPQQPRCDSCPVANRCVARKKGLTSTLPRLAPRPTPTKRRFVAFVLRRNGKVLVRQRPAGVLNAHLWEFPNVEVANDDGNPKQAYREMIGVAPAWVKALISIRHSITRYRIQLDVFQISPNGFGQFEGTPGEWFRRKDLEKLPFASAHKKVLAVI